MIYDILRQIVRRKPKDINMLPDSEDLLTIPVDPDSPWPKFRANALQNGRTGVEPEVSAIYPWEFHTTKGIFSSPVIDGAGRIYIGSADHYFYALEADGKVKWKFATEDILDSSALLDSRGQVIFGAGDGHVYCLDRETGREIWRFQADSPEEVAARYGIKTYNLNWFEGNVSMLADGTVIVPNDNYLVYALNPKNGKLSREYLANEMVWAGPAVNTDSDSIFFASCFFAAVNTYCYEGGSGRRRWTSGGLGSVSASPMLTSRSGKGAVVLGGFDGILRAFSQRNGSLIWKLGTRDHIYASPCQLSDGTIVQPSCDGTVYALDPWKGKLLWTFETSEPIRSSPAVDARDRIYFGSGEGRLYCLNRDGSFRWAYQCIDGDRNDLNGSPALGSRGIVIGGENGGIFFIPYDYPLSNAAEGDPRALRKRKDLLPPEGSLFLYRNGFGRLFPEPPLNIRDNEPISLDHFIRKEGKTILSAIHPGSLEVHSPTGIPIRMHLSANRKFITLSPEESWTKGKGGEVTITIRCRVKTGLKRLGLKFFGGRKTHLLEQDFLFSVPPAGEKKAELPYVIPEKPGDSASVLEISRFSCPSPTMLPSYNQIGFDSLHYLAGVVEGKNDHAVLWAVQGSLNEKTGETLVDPSRADFFVLNMKYDSGLLTLYNYDGFTISFFGSWDMPFGTYRISLEVDRKSGRALGPGTLNALIRSGEIKLYGNFLKLTGMSDMRTGHMPVSGAVNVDLWNRSPTRDRPGKERRGPSQISMQPLVLDPAEAESIKLDIDKDGVRAEVSGCGFKAGAHVYGILLIDRGSGYPLGLNYARKTRLVTGEGGEVHEIILEYGEGALEYREGASKVSGMKKIRAYVMVDMYPVFRTDMEIGGGV